MRKAAIYRNEKLAGTLTEEHREHYVFEYDDAYFNNDNAPAISLTLPKKMKRYTHDFLFPFFYNMLSEGVNRQLQCRHLQIDENDHFGLLLQTAQHDTIGPISVKEIST